MTTNKKFQPGRLLKDSASVGAMTLISRILGMIRDVAIASFLGASVSTDAFFVAFKIPNFFRRLCAEGAFSQAFVPVLAEYKEQNKFRDVKAMLANVSGTFMAFLALLTVSGILLAPLIIRIFAPGFLEQPEKLATSIKLLRITFPYLFFISISAFLGAILNSYGNFIVPALAPAILNICLISATIFSHKIFSIPVFSLAWGVFFAGILQFIFQLCFLCKMNLIFKPKFNYKSPVIKKIIKLTTPAVFAVSISQINLMLDTILASFLQSGSISWLYYSDRLSELPLGVIGIAIATVILPNLSKEYTQQSKSNFSATMNWAISLALMIGLPCSAALYVIAGPLLSTLFGHGRMSSNDIYMSSLSLKAYSLGLIAFMLIKILASGYFSQQNTKTPVAIAIKAMLANMILNLLLIVPLKHAGLALATTLSAWFNAIVLFYGLLKLSVLTFDRSMLNNILKMIVATVFMVVVLKYFLVGLEPWHKMPSFNRILQLSQLIIFGASAYFICLFTIGFPFRYLWKPRSFEL